MRALTWCFAAVLATGCGLAGGGGVGGGSGGGGGVGGGSGGGAVTFTKGWVYVKKDDRNLYAADTTDTEAPNRLITGGGIKHPSLSKDGKTVVFVRDVGSDTEIATISVAGGSTTTVFASTATVKNLRNPVFSPSGAKIAFAYDAGAQSVLGIVNADGTGFQSLTGTSSLSYSSPSFTPTGKALVAGAGSSGSQLLQIEQIDASTGASMSLTSTLGNEAQVISNRVVLSPDGLKAVFDGRVSSGVTRIFVFDLAALTISRLTDYPADPTASDSYPSWLGNDKVSYSSDTGGNDQVYSLSAGAMSSSGSLQVPSAIEAWYGPN
jgi:Tol biopolymer transport system component